MDSATYLGMRLNKPVQMRDFFFGNGSRTK
jgi:hypothetical protein